MTAVTLIGSRAAGTATDYSDWDFAVEVDDFHAVGTALSSRLAALKPLAQQWDPLSEHWCYMLMLAGPTKVDLLFPAEPHQAEPSWVVSAETLVPIDRHFWDWFLWLTSKEASGKNELVSAELDKMWRHLLRPLGIGEPPSALDKALWSYLEARQAVEAKLGVEVPRRLEREVRKVWPGSS
ncbi:MAG: nucleotidyltransferase domain-containing protein [Actinobacteria bacterium]|nr:MAG: nucleotidyltransferase domain-containing protein [Actinomycetota bacterium]